MTAFKATLLIFLLLLTQNVYSQFVVEQTSIVLQQYISAQLSGEIMIMIQILIYFLPGAQIPAGYQSFPPIMVIILLPNRHQLY